MNKDKTFTKVTEGVGYISGDYECWCIHSVPFDEWKESMDIDLSVYPSDFIPLEYEDILQRNEGDEPKVRYRVTFEVEFINEDDE